ncbi:MAG: ferrochelatase, partial [Psychrobacter urativorans]
YIPALNFDEAHIDLLEAMSAPLVKGWAGTLEGWA